MPHYTKQEKPAPAPTSPALTIATAAACVLGVGLLTGGTVAGHTPLLAWGVVTFVLAVGLGCLVAIRAMIECVVARSIDRTAVQVSGAIAEVLATEGHDRRDDGTVRLYS